VRAGLKVVDVINDFAGQIRVARARGVHKSEWKK
jgi:hypothetical protein